MNCSNCGTENRPGRKFCTQCGTALASTCPNCSSPIEPEARFCGECGTTLGGAGTSAPAAAARPGTAATTIPAPAAAAPVAERRLVSVLFADLVGFTTIAEGRDAEETRDLLSRYFDLARDTIDRYGGTVEKFIGDAVMAVWGAPTTREDDPERALRGAMELVEAVRSLGPGIEARASVMSGEAAVTIGAVGQGMVAGDIVNTASRLQGGAEPGTVVVNESTMRAASAAIVFEPVGEQTLKGKSLPVPAWRAVRIVAERGGRNRSDGMEAPFVGREEELRLLKELFHSTSREKRARLVSIIGPAGIGKSRLAWEFLKYIDGLIEDIYWHSGRSPAYGEGLTFWALGEMVRRRAGLVETDDEPTTRARITESVQRWVPDEAERRWIEPALLKLLGVGELRSGGAEELFSAWRTFFERIAANGSTVLVFEDLHWADAGLIDFIGHLLEWSKGLPIYVVTLARPELLDRHPDWASGKRNFTSIPLDPLPEASMRALLAGLVPGLPQAAASTIVARADGMPLYAVETVRMLVAEGKLIEDAGSYRPVADLTSLAIPDSLSSLIAARLDALDPSDRALIQDAAVLGQSFSPAALGQVTGVPLEELEPRLRALVRREILTAESDPRSPERGQYRFVQGLIREVAYNQLAKPDRRAKHLGAARHFQSLDTDELAGALAGHYLAAHQNTPAGPEADALAAQARVALRGAADRAALLGSHEQAIVFIEQALTVTTAPDDQASLHERAGESASAAGHHEAAIRHLRTAVDLRRALGDRLALAESIEALARVQLTAYEVEDVISDLEEAIAEFADLRDVPAVITMRAQLARAYYLHQSPGKALETVDLVLSDAEHANVVPAIADGLVTRGSALFLMGRAYEGLAVTDAGRRLADDHGLTWISLRALINLGVFSGSTNPRAAVEAMSAAARLAQRSGLRALAIGLATGVHEPSMYLGNLEGATADLDNALAEGLEAGDRTQLLATAVKLRAVLGEPLEPLVGELNQFAADITDRQMMGSLAECRGWIALSAGDLREAFDQFRKAAQFANSWPDVNAHAARAALWDSDLSRAREASAALDSTGTHGPTLDVARVVIRAGIAALEGSSDEALALYRQALDRWREIDVAFLEALTVIDMATLLDPTQPEVVSAIGPAREAFTRMGAKPFLHRLEEAAEARTAPVDASRTPARAVPSAADPA